MIAKFTTPFYPERFIRGNLNFLRNRLNRTFYEFITIGLQQILLKDYQILNPSKADVE